MIRPKIEISEELYNEIKELGHAIQDQYGRELHDPDVLFDKLDSKPMSLKEQIQRLMRVELSKQVSDQGMETFEEAYDFDIDEEFETPMVRTVYELIDEVPMDPEEREQVLHSLKTVDTRSSSVQEDLEQNPQNGAPETDDTAQTQEDPGSSIP